MHCEGPPEVLGRKCIQSVSKWWGTGQWGRFGKACGGNGVQEDPERGSKLTGHGRADPKESSEWSPEVGQKGDGDRECEGVEKRPENEEPVASFWRPLDGDFGVKAVGNCWRIRGRPHFLVRFLARRRVRRQVSRRGLGGCVDLEVKGALWSLSTGVDQLALGERPRACEHSCPVKARPPLAVAGLPFAV